MTHIDSSTTARDESGAPVVLPPAAVSPGGGAGAATQSPATEPAVVREIGGRKGGPEPTRFGDWELNGRCVDF